jgi:hypothetical protein
VKVSLRAPRKGESLTYYGILQFLYNIRIGQTEEVFLRVHLFQKPTEDDDGLLVVKKGGTVGNKYHPFVHLSQLKGQVFYVEDPLEPSSLVILEKEPYRLESTDQAGDEADLRALRSNAENRVPTEGGRDSEQKGEEPKSGCNELLEEDKKETEEEEDEEDLKKEDALRKRATKTSRQELRPSTSKHQERHPSTRKPSLKREPTGGKRSRGVPDSIGCSGDPKSSSFREVVELDGDEAPVPVPVVAPPPDLMQALQDPLSIHGPLLPRPLMSCLEWLYGDQLPVDTQVALLRQAGNRASDGLAVTKQGMLTFLGDDELDDMVSISASRKRDRFSRFRECPPRSYKITFRTRVTYELPSRSPQGTSR